MPLRQQVFKAAGTEQPHTETTTTTKTYLHYLHRAYLPCMLNVLFLILQQQFPVLLKDSNYALVCVGQIDGLSVQCH